MTNPQRPTPEQLGESILRGVKDFVTRATAPLQIALKALSDRIDALPTPEKGEAGEKGLDGKDGINGNDGAQGEKGADCDMAAVMKAVDELVAQRVAEAVAALPAPKDGRDGADGKDGSDGKDGEKGLDGRDGADGRDGINGKDGADGIHGRDAFEIAKAAGYTGTLSEWLVSLRGTDGLDGRDAKGEDGRDGLSCDEIVPFEDERSFGIRFMKGETVLSETRWNKPTLADLDEGTWEHRHFQRGSHVTWGGSTWFAKCDTSEEPGRGEDWRLMAKKGRDGRDRTERQRSGDSDVYRIKP